MKKSLLFLTMALCGSYAVAQNYHGFSVNATQELIDNPYKQQLSAETYYLKKGLNIKILFQPEYKPITPNPDNTINDGTTSGLFGGNEFVDYTQVTSEGDPTEDAVTSGKIDGFVVTPKMDANGLMYFEVPEQYYKAGQLVATPATGGDFRVRFTTYSSDGAEEKCRINDTEFLHTDDMTGIFVTVDAPSTVKITCNFVQANTTTTFNTGHVGGTKNDKYDDAYGKIQRTAVFELPSTKGNGPEDIQTSSEAVQFANLMKYARIKASGAITDPYAFPLTNVDLVFKGVKPGEKVGWTNLQTLHDGYTPSAVESIFTEDANVEPEYYNLQGIKVANPENGIFIERRGNVSRKVVK